MASEPSSSSSAGSFDDDRLPLHTIGHATRHTLPPRTLLGRVVYSAAAAVAAAAAAASRSSPSRALRFFSVRADVASSTVVPFLASFLSSYTPPPSAPFPFLHSFLIPLALSALPLRLVLRSRSFIWKLHLHFLMKSKLQWRALRAFLPSRLLISSPSSFSFLPSFLPSFVLPLCSRCFANRRERLTEGDGEG